MIPQKIANKVDNIEFNEMLIKYVRMKNSIRREKRPKNTYNPINRKRYIRELRRVSSMGFRKLVILCLGHNKHLVHAFWKNAY